MNQPIFSAAQTIQNKRDGKTLTTQEIQQFVAGVAADTISDAQIGAFTMATWLRGMDADERTTMTLAMRDSGDVLDWVQLDLNGPVLDKHSTGGVGDMVSLMLGPMVAACGGYVPMIAGKGLGHTGGTLDKLESIPGLQIQLETTKFQALVKKYGIAIVGQTTSLAPADRRFYAVRDVTATVDSIPLITASILSKKLAEGLDALVMDIKVGNGAFLRDTTTATQLATAISSTADTCGVHCNAWLTDMSQPLAWSAGNALEIKETLAFLRGDKPRQSLADVVYTLAADLLVLGKLASNHETAKRKLEDVITNGKAAEVFQQMIHSQGGPADLFERAEELLPAASVIQPVFASKPGFVESIDVRQIGLTVVDLGGGRHTPDQQIDYSVGLQGLPQVGASVEATEPLAWIHAASTVAAEQAAATLLEAIKISPEPQNKIQTVYSLTPCSNTNEK